MATLICNGTGNLTGATTFAGAEAGALANVLNRSTIESLANNATVTSVTFTVTNAKVIDAVLLWVRQGAAGSTGTFKVDLQKGGVSQASVTVNRVDLPVFVSSQTIGMMVPVLFKLSSTATGDGGSNWTIVLTNSNGTNTVAYAAATASTTNFTRALRTTTAATPAAADDLYVVGELTGAGTHTSRTVTMDSTATTAYGNGTVNSTSVNGGAIHVSNYGTLSYGTTASTNYVLRVNGDLWVWEQGTLNIGSSGAEIPRTSTAVLEFQMASASGDFGLRGQENAVVNIAGLSRTSAKNIVKCKLTADVVSSSVLTSVSPTLVNGTNTSTIATEATGLSLFASAFTGNTTNGNHCLSYLGVAITNTTQVATVWLARGSGTHNRFVRVYVGNATTLASVTNGFFAEVDLQAGTVGTVTAVGTGTATSVSITAVGSGFLIRMVGKCASGAATPSLLLVSLSAAATTSFVGVVDQSFIYDNFALVTAASISDTTYNVDTDTGWLSGDAFIIAATNRTTTDCEIVRMNANAGASSLVSAGYPFGSGSNQAASTHNGTSPIQAEIGLLTRNVKIRCTSNAFATYAYFTALCTATITWAEFYYVGVNTVGKRGVEVDATTTGTANAKSITFCSIHDIPNGGFVCSCSNSLSLNVTFSNNVMWNNTTGLNMVQFTGTLTNTDWTLDNNLFMRSSTVGVLLSDFGGTFTNNTVVGAGTFGFSLQEAVSTGALLGTFDGNTVHTSGNHGCVIQATSIMGTISNFASWRNGGEGILLAPSNPAANLFFSNITIFGNASIAGQIGAAVDVLNIIGTSNIIAGDTTFSSPVGISNGTATLKQQFNLQNVDMSGTTSIFAPHTVGEFSISSSALSAFQCVVTNCKFGAPNLLPVGAKAVWTSDSYFAFEKYNQTAGDHRCEMTYGQLKTDSTIFNTASPSMRMTPNNASNKLVSAPKYQGFIVPLASGVTKTISVSLRKAVVTDVTNGGTWNPSDKSSGSLTLSNGNLTATCGASSDMAVRATTGYGTGKYYFEVTTGATYAGGDSGIGICTGAATLSTVGSTVSLAALIYTSGSIWVNSSLIQAIAGGYTTAAVIGVAVDLDNKKIWFRINGGGWNGAVIGTENPAANLGGTSISAFVTGGATIYPCQSFNSSGSLSTANFGGSSFSNAAPSGFTAWTAGNLYNGNQPRLIQRANAAVGQSSDVVLATYSSGAGAWNQLSASCSSPTDDGAFEFIVDCDGTTGWINVDDWAVA